MLTLVRVCLYTTHTMLNYCTSLAKIFDNTFRDVNKHLRPISLTPVIYKIAEDFVVEKLVAPKMLSIINPVQFGVVPRSSATLALISMLHKWIVATDGTEGAVRVMLLDFQKAFDLIDHHLLVNKIHQLNMPLQVTNWVIDVLRNRFQGVKLANNCFSDWKHVPVRIQPRGFTAVIFYINFIYLTILTLYYSIIFTCCELAIIKLTKSYSTFIFKLYLHCTFISICFTSSKTVLLTIQL